MATQHVIPPWDAKALAAANPSTNYDKVSACPSHDQASQVPLTAAARAPSYADWRGWWDGEGRMVDPTWAVLEALWGYRRPMHAAPSRDTASLTDSLAPSCHERRPG
jgi:hypothetical protein